MAVVASSSSLKVGDRVLVRYEGEQLWHERLLLWPMVPDGAPEQWIVETPDEEIYFEQLAGGSPEDSPMEYIRVPRDKRLPAGLTQPTYRHAEFVDDDGLRRLIRAGHRCAKNSLSDEEMSLVQPDSVVDSRGRVQKLDSFFGGTFLPRRVRRDSAPPAPSPVDAAVVEAGGTPTPRADGSVWRACERCGTLNVALGDVVGEPKVHVGMRGLFEFSPGEAFSVELTTLSKEDFVAARLVPADTGAVEGNDARTLPVKTGARGRGREWREVVDNCEEEPFGDFPVAGLRSASWCLDF